MKNLLKQWTAPAHQQNSKTKKTKYKEEQIKNKERKNLFPY